MRCGGHRWVRWNLWYHHGSHDPSVTIFLPGALRMGLTRSASGVDMRHVDTPTRQSISFTRPRLAFPKQKADRLGVSIAGLVRRIIDLHRERLDSPAPRETAR